VNENKISLLKKLLKNPLIYKAWWFIGKNDPRSLPSKKKKYALVKKYRNKFGIKTLVETGTFQGRMILAVKDCFNKIYSIELDKFLYSKAVEKLEKYKHVNLFHGDSSKVLPRIIKEINEPVLFWLDAHYSGGITSKGLENTPILKELASIFKHKINNHVLLIDDADCFNGTNGYPTLERVKAILYTFKPHNWIFVIEANVIVIYEGEDKFV